METTRLSSKGQIVLPKEIRVARSLVPGTEFTVEDHPEGILLRPKSRFPRTTIADVLGALKYTGKPQTLAEMDEGIAEAVRLRHDRSRY